MLCVELTLWAFTPALFGSTELNSGSFFPFSAVHLGRCEQSNGTQVWSKSTVASSPGGGGLRTVTNDLGMVCLSG